MKNRSDTILTVLEKIVPFTTYRAVLFALGLLLINGCYAESASIDKTELARSYISGFGNIKTAEVSPSISGRDGIYWLNGGTFLIFASVIDGNKIEKQGLFQVDLDGSTHLLAENRSKKGFGFRYCFDGETIFIGDPEGTVVVVGQSDFLNIVIRRDRLAATKTNIYSSLRCKMFDRPKKGFGYRGLSEEDGLLQLFSDVKKIPWYGPWQATLVDDKGNEKLKIGHMGIGPYGYVNLIKFANSYYSPHRIDRNDRCLTLWWLSRSGWQVNTDKICLGSWATTSAQVIPFRGGYFVQHHNMKEPGVHLMLKGQQIKIIDKRVRGGAVSPDGCHVAYVQGPFPKSLKESPFSKRLHVFNACGFSEIIN